MHLQNVPHVGRNCLSYFLIGLTQNHTDVIGMYGICSNACMKKCFVDFSSLYIWKLHFLSFTKWDTILCKMGIWGTTLRSDLLLLSFQKTLMIQSFTSLVPHITLCYTKEHYQRLPNWCSFIRTIITFALADHAASP